MSALESAEQKSLVRWFGLQYPKLTMFAIPNGAHLAGDARQRAIKMTNMKAEGLVPGVSDLFLMLPKGDKGGLFIEMKATKGTVSDAQQDFINEAIAAGYEAKVCFGFDDAKSAIESYLKYGSAQRKDAQT